MAVAVHPRYDYGFYECGGKVYLIAVGLKAEVEKATGLELGEPILVCKGQQLELSLAKHPFYDRAFRSCSPTMSRSTPVPDASTPPQATEATTMRRASATA